MEAINISTDVQEIASTNTDTTEAADPANKADKSPQSRKWLLTFQHTKHIIGMGFDREKIKSTLAQLKSLVYWCVADEIGLVSQHDSEPKLHTHLFMCFSSPVRASRINKLFPTVNRQKCYGTAQQNRDYVSKTGTHENSDKATTRIEGSFEEGGTMPLENQGARNDLAALYGMVKEGASNFEILETNPEYMTRLTDIERTRLTILEEKYKTTFRILDVQYYWGKTRLGKTRKVMEENGYENVFRITDYAHPFDGYGQQDVICFDEFFGHDSKSGKLQLSALNEYLDGYPCVLPARYSNKKACYTKVFIVSNVDLWYQFEDVRIKNFARWEAFVARFTKIVKFNDDGTLTEIDPQYYTQNKAPYILNANGTGAWAELPPDTPTPFVRNGSALE